MPTEVRPESAPAVASLPMYDWPEVSSAIDRLWSDVTAELRELKRAAPARLDRRASYSQVWTKPGLMLSQTCGYPYATKLRGKVALVGAPVYDAPGCVGPSYRSVLIVRRNDPATCVADLRGRRATINGHDSQSGYSALRAVIAPYAAGGRFFRSVTVSGSHRASIRAVAEGRVDVAAIDAVCWSLAQRHEPAAYAGLRILADSPAAPSLPFITSVTGGPQQASVVFGALRKALAAGQNLYRKELFLVDVVAISDEAYDRILEIEARAAHLGYPEVA